MASHPGRSGSLSTYQGHFDTEAYHRSVGAAPWKPTSNVAANSCSSAHQSRAQPADNPAENASSGRIRQHTRIDPTRVEDAQDVINDRQV